jgi:hypothetical protein
VSRNQTRERHNLTHTCENHTLRVEVTLNHFRACQNHNACENYTMRVQITLKRVVITLVRVVITLVSVTFIRIRVSLV